MPCISDGGRRGISVQKSVAGCSGRMIPVTISRTTGPARGATRRPNGAAVAVVTAASTSSPAPGTAAGGGARPRRGCSGPARCGTSSGTAAGYGGGAAAPVTGA